MRGASHLAGEDRIWSGLYLSPTAENWLGASLTWLPRWPAPRSRSNPPAAARAVRSARAETLYERRSHAPTAAKESWYSPTSAARSSPSATCSRARPTATSGWSTLHSSRALWRPPSCRQPASRSRTSRGRRRKPAVPASSESTVALPAGVALHARPAATFVKTALRFRSRMTVALDGKVADAKSILAVLALGAVGGTELRLTAEGEDAPDALAALSSCVSGLVE